jgi:uncharacterized protein (DUF2249 family)
MPEDYKGPGEDPAHPNAYEWFTLNHLIITFDQDSSDADIIFVAGIRTNTPPDTENRCFSLLLSSKEYRQMKRKARKKLATLNTVEDIELMTDHDPSELPTSVFEHPSFGSGENFSLAVAESAHNLTRLVTKQAMEKAHSPNPIVKALNILKKIRLFRVRGAGTDELVE